MSTEENLGEDTVRSGTGEIGFESQRGLKHNIVMDHKNTLSMTYYLINHSEQTTLGDIILEQIPESMDTIKTLKNQ